MTDKVPLSADASVSPCFCQPPPVSKIATILSEIFPLLHFRPFFWHLGEKKNSFSLLYEGNNQHPSRSKYLLDQDFKLREGCHCGSFVWLNFQPQGAFPHG